MMKPQHEEDEVLANLLNIPDPPQTAQHIPPHDDPLLTVGEEHKLLEEANSAGTPTLVPSEVSSVDPGTFSVGKASIYSADSESGSFGTQITKIIHRYPLPSFIAAIGLAYLLARRRGRYHS